METETETENVSQQTDWSIGTHNCIDNRCCNCCISKASICVSLLLFLTLALLFAVVFLGRTRIRQRLTNYTDDITDTTNYPGYISRRGVLKEINVDVTTITTFPFVGALISINPLIFLCPLIVITNRYLLTGAACFTTRFTNISVRVGSNYWDKGGYSYEIDSFIINDKYNFTTMENNLALIKLKTNLTMESTVQKIKIKLNSRHKSQTGMVVGWNMWSIEGYPFTILIKQEKHIWEPTRCKSYLKRNTNLLCVLVKSNRCTLLDLTGPLIINNEVVGLWTSGISCLNKPAFYTNLKYHLQWIKQIVLHK